MKIASVVPPACASCHLQRLDEPHVDFEVAYDGPVLPPTEGGVRYTVDDLIICGKCLTDAARLLGLGDVTAAEYARDQAMSLAQRQAAEATEALDTLDAVRTAFEALGLPAEKVEQIAQAEPTPEPEPTSDPAPAKRPRAKKVQG